MQLTNGSPAGAGEMLETVKALVERLQGEIARQQQEMQQLRAQRDNFRDLVVSFMKEKYDDPKMWDEKEFAPGSMTEMLANIKGD